MHPISPLAATLITAAASAAAIAQNAPTELRATATDGITLVADVTGPENTTPVLLLSGGPGFAGSHLRTVADALDDHQQVILLDQRGSGRSTIDDVTSLQWSIDTYVNDLEAVRSEAGIDKWSIVGHSWGAILASAYAARHPDHVERVALIGPAGLDATFWPTYQTNIFAKLGDNAQRIMADVPPPTEQSMEAFAEYSRAMNRAMAPAMLADTENETAIAALRDEMSAEHYFPVVGLIMQSVLQSFDLKDAVANFEGEVLVLQGDADPIGPGVPAQIVEHFPSATAQTIEDAGHFLFLEQPEALNTALIDFLNSEESPNSP